MFNNFLLKKYLKLVLTTYFPEAVITKYDMVFRCNICGDSKKSKTKKRAHFKDLKGNIIFKCFNCNYNITPTKWLKKYYPEFYKRYIGEVLQNKDENNEQIKVEKLKPKIKEDKYTKKFIPILRNDTQVFKDAIELIKNRKIPKQIWKGWYIALDGRYKNRIIIPIYDKDNMIVYWQGRSIYNQYPKYLNCLRETEKAVFAQLEVINKNKPIIIQEGLIDSKFVENGLTTLSSSWCDTIQKKLDELNCYYVLDFDITEQTKKKAIKLLNKKKYLFNWKKYLQDHCMSNKEKWDINKLYLYEKRDKIYTFNELEKYFTNNYYDKIWFM